MNGMVTVDQADILNSLKEAGCIRDSSDDCESEIMDRLLEHNVKWGVAR